MKKFLKILILAVLAISCLCLCFACGDNDGNKDAPGLYVKKFAGDEYWTVYKYVGSEDVKTLDVAKQAKDEDGNAVTVGRIMEGAFKGDNTLTELVIPSTVEKIDAGAFEGMKKLSSLTLPFVGAGANADASFNQTNIDKDKITDTERTFGYVFGTDEYTEGVKFTQVHATGAEDKTTDYYIPKTLNTVKIAPKNDYSIPMYAFAGGDSNWTFVNKVVLTNKVVGVGDYAFRNCKGLTAVEMTASVKTLGKYAFYNCSNLKELSATGLETIGSYALSKSGVKEFKLADGVKTVSDHAFAESKIVSVDLNKVETISNSAFYKCLDLTTVKTTVAKTIKANAFDGCIKLSTFGSVTGEANFVANAVVENVSFANVPQTNFTAINGLDNGIIDNVFFSVK